MGCIWALAETYRYILSFLISEFFKAYILVANLTLKKNNFKHFAIFISFHKLQNKIRSELFHNYPIAVI